MANQMLGMPILMDTATANWAANALPGQQALQCYMIRYLNATTAGHAAVIKNAEGSTIFTVTAEAAINTVGNNQTVYFNPRLELSKTAGWYLSSITSGVLYIYFT